MKTVRLKCVSLAIALLIFFVSCKQEQKANSLPDRKAATSTEAEIADPLPSWNEGTTKQAIIDFVTATTTAGSAQYIAIEDRIATFDNDGNLWAEQPAYFQLLFAMDRIKDMAGEHPEWKDEQPFKAVLENDLEALSAEGLNGVLTLVMTTHAGMDPEGFKNIVSNWMKTARHPKTGKPYNLMIYQPMLELLEYLRSHEFKTFIVSGGGVEFMRAWVEDAYGIPPYQVVGSSIKTEFTIENGQPVIRRLPELEFIDDKEGKPIGINRFIGKIPVFASGNSDGDLQMLLYSDTRDPSFQLYLHHTDSIREWAYDRESHIGKLDKGLEEAKARGWTVIDMAEDWKQIYPE